MDTSLPNGYSARAPTTRDLDVVLGIIRAHEAADEGDAEYTADDLRGDWKRERFALGRDAWLVHGPDGALAAYGNVWPRAGYALIQADGYVHPEHRSRGVGRWLVRTMEARARKIAEEAAPGEGVALQIICYHPVRAARALFESEGYEPERYFWRMTIDMDEPPPEPALPEGMSFRTFRPGDEKQIHELVMTAFADNAGHQYTTFEEWRGFMMARETFEPDLWFLIEGDGRIVAAVLCPDYEEHGWVRQFAVHPDYRRRGLAIALLHYAFRAQFNRGHRRVSLVVDSYNRTGAERVYQRAGMHIERQHDAYQKILVQSDHQAVTPITPRSSR